jgi:transcriptional regulator with XRE-family HTH domain
MNSYDYGLFLKSERKKLKYSKQKLSELTGLSINQIEYYEERKDRPFLSYLTILYNAGLDLYVLFDPVIPIEIIQAERKRLGYSLRHLELITGISYKEKYSLKSNPTLDEYSLLKLKEAGFVFNHADYRDIKIKKKYCFKCDEVKPKAEFSKNISNGSGLADSCKSCMIGYENVYYEKNKQQHVKLTASNKAQYKQRNKELALKYLSDKHCKNCDSNLDFYKNDGHESVSLVIQQGNSINRLNDAIKHSNFVCKNCGWTFRPNMKALKTSDRLTQPFKVLEESIPHRIRKIKGDPLKIKMLESGQKIDIDSPIGANDTIRVFCAFIQGHPTMIDYDFVPNYRGF